MNNTVSSVAAGSPAEKAGLKAGDRLLKVDDNEIFDVLDYMYYAYDSNAEFTVERDGETLTVTVCKEDGQDAGIEFETYLMDKPRHCANNCIFCFVDQLPAGMRDTLYFKDDDVRLSFLTGSYITLTNMSEREIQRIVDLKISPINISVHTMDPNLRSLMLGNKNAGRGVEIIKRLAAAGIEMNCQIVCCSGINDGKELKYTMQEMAKLYPAINSVSVIPVGLTKHRDGLYPLKPYDKKSAGDTVNLVEKFAARCLRKHKSRIFFCSDEFYLKAERDIPEDSFYEGYPQLENGVGLLRLMITEFEDELKFAETAAKGTHFSIVTGVSAAPFMETLVLKAKEKFPEINGKVYPIVNDFFGHTIDVAGLITGQDIINQLKGKELGDRVYITNRMLRDGGNVFLDDVSVEELERSLNVSVIPIENSGAELLRAMME